MRRPPPTAQPGSPRTSTSSTRAIVPTSGGSRRRSRRTSLRGAPEGLPFVLDAPTLERGLNFTLTSKLGDLDLLGEIVGGGRYADLLPHCIEIELFGVRRRCLGLSKLIEVKRAAGRPKDLEALAELEAIRRRSE